MPHVVRTLTDADQAAAWALGAIAFGYHDRTMPEGWTSDRAGRRTWGVFDADQRLLAKAVDREQSHWFGGSLVPASGVAGVAVMPELRGQGLAGLALRQLLADARERGAAVSTLFNTTPYPYRRAGFEEAGSLVRVAVPTASLSGVRVPAGLRLRPATPADVPALRSLYRDFARSGTALMDRDGPVSHPNPSDYLASYDGVSVVVADDEAIEGYVSYDRGPGYDQTGRLVVDDLIALTPAAAHAIGAFLASWASVAPTISMKAVPGDPLTFGTAIGRAPVEYRQPWMLRVIDAAAAVAARGWPAYLTGTIDLHLVDTLCPWNAGNNVLRLDGGVGRIEPGGSGAVRMTERGLALWYAGGLSPAALRRAGLLAGSDASDALLLAATAGPTPVLLDYF
jgi:predicted acetyltransferase